MIDVIKLTPSIEVIKLDIDYTVSFYNQLKRNYLLGLLNDYSKSPETSSSNNKFTIVLNHVSLIRKNPQELNAVSYQLNLYILIENNVLKLIASHCQAKQRHKCWSNNQRRQS